MTVYNISSNIEGCTYAALMQIELAVVREQLTTSAKH